MTRQIKVSDSTHKKLEIVKRTNRTGSFDGAIIHMLEGCTDELDVIKRNQTALTLTYEGYDNSDVKTKTYDVVTEYELDITYKQLRKADVGDIFEPQTSDEMYYSYSIATVVYTDEDFVALKITTYTELEWYWDGVDVRLIGVYLF